LQKLIALAQFQKLQSLLDYEHLSANSRKTIQGKVLF
jgi:hypothetical protein